MTENKQRYQVLRHLATGGMAEIWLARQRGIEGFEKLVVLKRILPHLLANREFLQMFVDEGRLAAQLSHPNIVQIFDLGKMNESLFIAMEFVQGENLRYVSKRIEEKKQHAMPAAYAAKIISQACEALYYAHTKTDNRGDPLGLVHRDLSPANILVSYQGQVKIVDFGIAKAATHIRETRVGMVKGHYGYMSPEQCSSQPLDYHSDIFSLGVVLWEMLTGKRLYARDNDLATVKAICETKPASPTSVLPGIPSELEMICMRALEKRPEDRFKDCHRMHMALERFLHAQGSPITPVHLARYMKTLFPDRLVAWQKVIQTGGEAEFDSDTVDSLSYVFNMGTPSRVEHPPEKAGASAPTADNVKIAPDLLTHPEAGPAKAPVSDSTGIQVEILVGGNVIREVLLPDEAVIGSGANAHLRAAGDPNVAEKHALLHRDLDTIMLTTTGGPVDVNGERVDFAVLAPTDLVSAGRFTFRVKTAAPGQLAPPSAGADATMVVTRPPEIAQAARAAAAQGAGGLGSAPLPLPEELVTDPTGAAPKKTKKPKNRGASAAAEPATRAERVPPMNATAAPDAAAAAQDARLRKQAKRDAATKAKEELAAQRKAKAAAEIARKKQARQQPSVAGQASEREESLFKPRPPPPVSSMDLSNLAADGASLDLYVEEEDDDRLGQPSAFPLASVLGDPEQAKLSLSPGSEDREAAPVAEVLQVQQEVVLRAARLVTGQRFKIAGTRAPLVKMRKSGARLRLPQGVSGFLYPQAGAAERLQGPSSVDLPPNARASLQLDDGEYRIRVFQPAAAPPKVDKRFASKLWGVCAGLAFFLHLTGFGSLVLVQTLDILSLPVTETAVVETFAEGKLADAKKKKKKKKRKKKKKKRKLAAKKQPKQDPTEAHAKIPKRLRQRLNRRLQRKGGGGGGATSLLNALHSPVAGEGTTLKEVVSNIDAIKGGGSRGAMRVAGTLSGLPGGHVNLARGGGGELGTLSGTEVAGNGVGKLKGRGGRGKVRGSVSSVRALARVSGQLSREEVIKVINSKLGKIQGCYERQLGRKPTLSGKITFEWTVRTNGRVSSAREKTSSMGNAKVSQCILGVIRTMKFPRPRGGEVVIAYPFMFRSVS